MMGGFLANAQEKLSSNVGITVGLTAGFGTGFDRLGFCFKAYYLQQQVQFNYEMRLYFSLRNAGPSGFYPEGFAGIGIVYGYGSVSQYGINPFMNVVSNQTGKINSLGYGYNFYFNNIGTSQRTGTVSFQFNSVTIISEDDLFASAGKDKFRTGAFLIQYNYQNLVLWGLNCTLWTGKMGYCRKGGDYKSLNGYLDTTDGRYCSSSNGFLSLQAKTIMPMFGSNSLTNLVGQEAQANIGIDAEQVRHIVQNKIIHDMQFLPKKWRSKKNCHIPMLDDKNNPYLFEPGQKIRPAKLYLNGFSNPSLFY